MKATYPPGPQSLLGIRLARQMQRDVLGFSLDLARRYGDAASFRCGPVRFFQFTHPDLVHQVLVKQAKHFRKPARFKQILGKWDGEGLLLSEGELWVRQRRLVQQAFQPRRIHDYAHDMVAYAQQMLDRWQPRSEVDAVEEMHRVTLDIVGKTLFGVDLSTQADETRRMVQDLQDAALDELGRFVPLPDWLPLPGKRRLRRAMRYMNDLIGRIISQRRATGEDRGDLLSMLLLSVDQEGDGRGMSDQQARDETMTLLLAGHETTATTLVWTLYLLAKHPDVQERLAAEVERVVGDRAPTADDASQMAEIDMALKEAMRLYPAVYFTSREAAEDLELGGFTIPRGSQVHLLPYATYHDPRWFEDPESFRPQRFAPGYEERLPACAYMPFGAGPRACIGRSMATLEAALVLAVIVRRYRLSLAPGQGKPVMQAQISLHPAGPVRLAIDPRQTSGDPLPPRVTLAIDACWRGEGFASDE